LIDFSTTLFLLRLVKLVIEICLLALVGQGIVFVLIRGIGQDAKNNFFYRVLETVSSPFVRLARFITPRFVPDRHLPLAVVSLLALAYVLTLFLIADACVAHGLPVPQCLQRQ
jgi:hypothetical protein